MPSRTIDFSVPIPLFPLPNCVLLPHATIPLHVFEPRYRSMVHDALRGRKLIAMAVFDGDTWKQDYLGEPPLRDYVCVGLIVKHERLSDGRYNLLLQGVCRASVAHEVAHEHYRLAILKPLETRPPMEIDLADQRRGLEQLLGDPLLKQLASVSAVRNWVSDEIPTAALTDLAIMTICGGIEDRYHMLSECDPRRRARWLTHHLEGLRHTLVLAQPFDHARDEDGLGLN